MAFPKSAVLAVCRKWGIRFSAVLVFVLCSTSASIAVDAHPNCRATPAPIPTASHSDPRKTCPCTATPCPSPPVTTCCQPTLTEPDAVALARARERDRFLTDAYGGVGKTLTALAWPAAIIIIAVLAYSSWRQYLRPKVIYGAPLEGLERANKNDGFDPSADEIQAANEAAQQLVDGFAQSTASQKPALSQLMVFPLTKPDAKLENARAALETLFQSIIAHILSSQFEALLRASRQVVTINEMRAMYRSARDAGYNRSLTEWYDFLIVAGLMTNTAPSDAPVFNLQQLGSIFVGWADARRYSVQSVRRMP